jgi:hypothetical protein
MALEKGKYISKELSEYIAVWVNLAEIKKLAKEHDLSDELARKMCLGERKLTDKNINLMIDILKTAIYNRNHKLPGLEKTNRKAKKFLS